MKATLITPIQLSTLAEWCGGVLHSPAVPITKIATHTSELSPGDLFVALKGENFDGEEFIGEAKKRGAYVFGEHDTASLSVKCTRTALLAIAKEYKRNVLKIPHTIAITGSVGKTMTKEFTKAILSRAYKTHATFGNLNNEIGVAFTILTTPKETETLICELGMNHLGEISRLTDAVAPSVAVITKLTSAHIGNLGSREMIAKAKLEIAQSIRLRHLLIPYGEPLLKAAPHGRTVSAKGGRADFSLSSAVFTQNGCTFDYYALDKLFLSAKCKIPGEHVAEALAYAITIGYLLDIPASQIEDAILALDPTVLRQREMKIGQYRIYDDSYSSSPEAVMAIADMLSLSEKGPSALLGDMLELGDKASELHEKVGRYIARKGFKKLYTFGKYGEYLAKGAILGGIEESCIFQNPDTSDLGLTLQQIKNSYGGEMILIKGSHALGMHRIIEAIARLN